jgi:phosphoribosyl 1,2-cyclic phosphodiesterase
MVLKVLGSGSSGNCYLLENENECLILDAGIPTIEVKKALDFNIKKIVGVCVTHCHKDHDKYSKDFEKMGIPVYRPFVSKEVPKGIINSSFMVQPFDNIHDVDCYGFHVKHNDIGTLVYATDTEYIKYRFKGINHYLIEANYSMDYVDKSKANYEHTLKGHQSIDTCLKYLAITQDEKLRNVILCHLSQDNASNDNFIERAEKVCKSNCFVAKKGIVINLSLVPF